MVGGERRVALRCSYPETHIMLAENEGALPAGTLAEQIRRLQALYDAGLITVAELHARRVELIVSGEDAQAAGTAPPVQTR